MNCLVTGGAGFIGSHLSELLVNLGHKVVIYDDLSTGKQENIQHIYDKVEFYKHDVCNLLDHFDTLAEKEFDAIFHLAALARIQPSFRYPNETLDINVNGTQAVLELARRTNKGAIVVYAGSSSFYHDIYANPYSFSKWAGEQLCQMYRSVYGVKAGVARFFNVYGPRQLEEGDYATVIGIFERQKRNSLPLTVTGDGSKRRDFTHVTDIVNGLHKLSEYLASDTAEKITYFQLGTGTNHSIKELADMFNPETIEYLPSRMGEAETTLADVSQSKQLLGWSPTIKVEDYVKGLRW